MCGNFKQLDVVKRWECAKQCKLCFRCLGDSHLGQHCNRTRVCGISGCKEVHHRLLHKDKAWTMLLSSQDQDKVKEPEKKEELQLISSEEEHAMTSSSPNEVEHGDKAHQDGTYTIVMPTLEDKSGMIALRTIPVYLKNGSRKIKVNTLLDDASTKSYINSDVAAELGLEGQLRRANLSILNGQIETFETTPVVCDMESLDGKSRLNFTAFTVEKVTGDMKAMDWNICAGGWPDLHHLEFPKLGPSLTVDALIGLDRADLHYSLRDIHGALGQPIVRSIPLGWTCIGVVGNGIQHKFCSHLPFYKC